MEIGLRPVVSVTQSGGGERPTRTHAQTNHNVRRVAFRVQHRNSQMAFPNARRGSGLAGTATTAIGNIGTWWYQAALPVGTELQ